jgi:organic radical activating enzyme
MSFLPVMEHFYTLQGEGVHTGKAAYFIRLGGCDVGCVWCDVKESWEVEAHPKLDIHTLVKSVQESGAPLAVITGGEPLMHDCTHLTTTLLEAKIRTHIETSGSSPLSGKWDWICVSPKKFKPVLPELLSVANELKIIIYNKHDLEWAEPFSNQVRPECRLLLQPEWSKHEQVQPLITEYIKSHPRWSLSLQTHKYLNIP